MPIDERTRLRIRQWFMEQVDDEEMADAIMESLPPVEWSELVTKQDLALTTRELRAEMGELRVELKTEMNELRGDIAKISYDLASFQRTMILMLIGFALTIWVSLLVA